MKKTLLFFLGLIVVLGLFAYYFGLFGKLVFVREDLPSFNIFYTKYTGDYSTVGNSFDNLKVEFDKLFASGSSQDMVGIYLDDPKKVDKNKLRSIVGIIFTGSYSGMQLPSGYYTTGTKELRNVLSVEFPYKNTFSIILGTMKVYPAIAKHVEVNNIDTLAILEIYSHEKTKYIVIQNQIFLDSFN